jgi:hypothetical protein
MRRVLLLLALLPALTGCFPFPSLLGAAPADPKADLRAAVPAIEAWYAEHGSYAGLTLANLRTYDDQLPDTLELGKVTRETYCVETTGTGETWSYRGPSGGFSKRSC